VRPRRAPGGPRFPQRVPAAARFSLLLVPALLTPGCELRFTDPFQGEPADLLAQLRILDAGNGEASFSAHLTPGRASDGTIRRAEDGAVEVLGLRVESTGVREEGVLSYGHTWSLPAGEPLPELRFRRPTLESIEGGDPGHTFGDCARADPSDRGVAPGDTLRFTASCSPSGPHLRHTEWDLEVRTQDVGGLVLYLHSNSSPPPELEVPVDWLGQPGSPDLDAILTITRILVWNDGPGHDYRVALTVRWAFSWTIRWEDREGGVIGPLDPTIVSLGPA
jgi:hypothetical protein